MKKLIVFLLLLMNASLYGQQIILNEPIRFLALGDSYTIGENVAQGDRWPNQLMSLLDLRGYELDNLNIIARTGWRTDDLLSAIKRENPPTNYNLVSLLIGVNNQFQGADFADYPVEFRQLLNQAINFCGGQKSGVFVLSIPDYGYTPFGSFNRDMISSEIDEYNEINKSISQELGITYIDITPISREAEVKPEYIATDNLHPSSIMYGQWVKEVIRDMDLDSSANDYQVKENPVLKVYPNPCLEHVKGVSQVPISDIIIYNMWGDEMIYQPVYGNKQFQIDVSMLSSGIYFYRIEMMNQQYIKGKLVVK